VVQILFEKCYAIVFSSPELKVQVSFFDRLLSIVCLSVNFYIFHFFSRTSKPNSIKLGTDYPWAKGIQVCSNKGPNPLQRGDNKKMG
jgi:hypothetical protein